MKRFCALAAALAASLAVASCGTTGGVQIGGTGSPLGDVAAFTQADLANAEATAVANNDTLAIPCYPALSKWLASVPGTGNAITVSGAASAFEAGRVVVNGVQVGVPTAIYQACGPLYMQAHGQLLKLIAGAGALAKG